MVLRTLVESNIIATNNNKGKSSRVRGQRRSHRRSGGDSVGKYFGDAWSLAKRTAYGLNEVRKLINIETKICDSSQSPTAADNTGYVVPLTQMAQGLNYTTNRVGNSIKLQNIVIRYKWQISSLGVKTAIRTIVFRDLDGYGTAPVTGDVLEAVGTTLGVLNPKDFLNSDRFSILYDDLDCFSITNDQMITRELHIPHEGHVKYLGTTAAAASNGKGSVYIMVLSDESTNTPTFAFHARVFFTDD